MPRLKKHIAARLRTLAARLDPQPQPTVATRVGVFVSPPVTYSCGSGGTARITHINGQPV